MKKKHKILKTFSFTSLALLMGAAGVFAFAPLGASPIVANANEMVDQINTKADGENIKYAPSPLGLDPENDPVIYTTESGLEIKYGGESVSDQLASSQPLAGYPYFTMGTYNGYAVNWVIIGRNTNDTVFTSAISSYLYSTWKTNNNVSSATFTTKAKYWFNGGGYETTTPAGSAINGVVPSKSYVADVTKATKSVVGKDEVPSGCVLAVSEKCLGAAVFNTAAKANYETSSIKPLFDNLYSSGLGLTSAQKALIKSQTIQSTTSTNTTVTSSSKYFFPFAYTISGYTQAYCIQTYLTSNALRISYDIGTTTARQYWTRSGSIQYGADAYYVTTAGGFGDCGGEPNVDNVTGGVRPICIIKLG